MIALDELLAWFETGEMPLEHWDHAAHLRVAAWAVTHLDEPLPWMRTRLHRLLAHHGIETTKESGYHETITAAWLRLVAWQLQQDPSIEAMLTAYADKRHLLRYWSRDVMMGWEARERWVEPDVAPLPASRSA